ncbi:hypothetical protein CHARACLAT_007632 [Characodon lateralis]|uniref:Uncharacterized protein n=1 Tax=Characodon lateralis TaxID=208331 RepID=A0ABU7ERZ6_9TELE|nr:hypothetical protein [Characodon lateralis]
MVKLYTNKKHENFLASDFDLRQAENQSKRKRAGLTKTPPTCTPPCEQHTDAGSADEVSVLLYVMCEQSLKLSGLRRDNIQTRASQQNCQDLEDQMFASFIRF